MPALTKPSAVARVQHLDAPPVRTNPSSCLKAVARIVADPRPPRSRWRSHMPLGELLAAALRAGPSRSSSVFPVRDDVHAVLLLRHSARPLTGASGAKSPPMASTLILHGCHSPFLVSSSTSLAHTRRFFSSERAASWRIFHALAALDAVAQRPA